MDEINHTDEPIDERELLPCPECGELTDSLKQYRFMNYCLFLGLAHVHQDIVYRGCPACIRRFVVRKSLLNIVPANVVWPFLFLPWGLALIALAGIPGHSRAVLEGLTPELVVERERIREEAHWHYASVVFALMLCWVPVFGFVVCLAACYYNRRSSDWTRPASRWSVVASVIAPFIVYYLREQGFIRWP